MSKVSFDATTRVISITAVPVLIGGEYIVAIDIGPDIYSQGKVDWIADPALRKLKFPVSVTGGDPLPGSKELGSTFFLKADWKIAPYEADHRLLINGNFYSTDGKSVFNKTIGAYNVFVEQTVSSLVDAVIVETGSAVTAQDKLDIADAVWDEALAAHLSAGSAGEKLNDGSTGDVSITEGDKLDIADKVWNKVLP